MIKKGIILVMILIFGFILSSGCSELGIHIDETDNRSHAIPFYGETINETTGIPINDTPPAVVTPPEKGVVSIIIDLSTIIAILAIITYTSIKLIRYVLREIRLEDRPPLNP